MLDKHKVKRHSHPGRGGRAISHPKGRQLDTEAQDEIRLILGDIPRARDMLIEFLHLIQDKFGCLSADHLVALADEMKLSLAEIYEVATFYAHFDVITETEDKPPPITVRVCDSVTCQMLGAEKLITSLKLAATISKTSY